MDLPVEEGIEKIAKECEEAGASKWDITKIVKELSKAEPKDIKSLRSKAIEILEEINPKAASVYVSFHRLRVYTTNEKIEPFDRGNIIKSLLKETDVNRSVAENIGNEVENKIKDYKIKYLTTALIREMVNAKLLEYGYENIQNQYTRLGMPVYDVEKKLKTGLLECDSALKEFNLLKIIPRDVAEKHFEGTIFIEDISGFSTRGISYCLEPVQGKTLSETIVKTMMLGEKIGRFFRKEISVNCLNLYLSESISKNKEIAESVALSKTAFEKNCIGVNLFSTDEIEETINLNKAFADKIANEFIKCYAENMQKLKIVVDGRFKLKLLEKTCFQEGLTILNCSKELLFPHRGLLHSKTRGISSLVSVNVPKLAAESKGREKVFSEILENTAETAERAGALRKKELNKRNYFKKAGIDTPGFENCVSLYGTESSSEIMSEKQAIRIFSRKGLRNVKTVSKEAAARFSRENNELGIKQGNTPKTDIAGSKKELYEKIKQGVPLITLKSA